MAPVEMYLGDSLVFSTCTGPCEVTIPGIPMVINYSGDNGGSVVSLKHPDGERMTGFSLEEPGQEQIMRFEQNVELPVERNRSGRVNVTKILKFKKV